MVFYCCKKIVKVLIGNWDVDVYDIEWIMSCLVLYLYRKEVFFDSVVLFIGIYFIG